MELLSPSMAAALDNPAAAMGFLAAMVVGIASSVHCILMCGPLACAGFSTFGKKGSRRAAAAAYQLGRLASYTGVGAALGGLGGGIAQVLSISVRPYLPWVMAATLVATAFELGKRLPAIPGFAPVVRGISRASGRLSPVARSGTIGALTPLLPCGLLYGISAAAIAIGSAGGGALVMGGFALGSGPALLLAQAGLGKRLLPAAVRPLLQRGIPLAAAAVLVYRAIGSMGGDPPICH